MSVKTGIAQLVPYRVQLRGAKETSSADSLLQINASFSAIGQEHVDSCGSCIHAGHRFRRISQLRRDEEIWVVKGYPRIGINQQTVSFTICHDEALRSISTLHPASIARNTFQGAG